MSNNPPVGDWLTRAWELVFPTILILGGFMVYTVVNELVKYIGPEDFVDILVSFVPWLVIMIPLSFCIGVIFSRVINPAQKGSVITNTAPDVDFDDWEYDGDKRKPTKKDLDYIQDRYF